MRGMEAAAHRLLHAAAGVAERAAIARAANLPICNLGSTAEDAPTPAAAAADTALSRAARNAGALLWARDPKEVALKLPPEDPTHPNNPLAAALRQSLSDMGGPRGKPLSVEPSLHRGVVVEVHMSHVLVTAIDREAELAEAEGLGSGMGGDDGAAALKLLRGVVQKWIAAAQTDPGG